MSTMYKNVSQGTRWGRLERIAQIEEELASSPYDVHTVNSISKLIGIKPSTHLRGILADMASRGDILVSTEGDDSGTVTRRLYALPTRAPRQVELYSGDCWNCGTSLPTYADKCIWCGAELGESS